MSKGFLSFVLHAHLPFVRHPEYEHFLEENWLFEAISETYLPLLRMMNRLRQDGLPFRITLLMSPTLTAMLSDELLQNRYIRHLEKNLELAEKEVKRTASQEAFQPLAVMYRDLYQSAWNDFTRLYKKNILKGFKELEKAGFLEIGTSAATHAFLPLFENYPEAIEAQIHTAVISHGRIFGNEPKGFWLPESGYFRGLEKYLRSHKIKYFFTAAHGCLFAEEKPERGVYAPLDCHNGVNAFARDVHSSKALWDPGSGYPADYTYREFYRDIGYDLDMDYIRPYIHDGDIRINTGFKYYAITGSEVKKPYNIEAARRKVIDHAENFLFNRSRQCQKLENSLDRPAIIVSPYDAELFGHWWFEGPSWIENMIRRLPEIAPDLEMVTPGDYLALYPDNQSNYPAFSSFGNQGYAEVWLDGKNDWIYRHVHKAIERMNELVERYPDETSLKLRVLNQAAREVLLSQASDWPFIMKTGTTVPYAVKRLREHLYNFNTIYDNLCRNTVNTEWLTRLEKKNNVFPDIDYRIFNKNQPY